MKKLALFLGMFAVLSAINSVSADQYGCNGQYGGYGGYGSGCPTNQTILIDKTVGKSSAMTKGGQTAIEFVDNLSTSDLRFKPSDFVYFQLKVKNTSDKDLVVTVKDTLPMSLVPVEGPGTYDANTKLITIPVGTLRAGEEKMYTIKTKIGDANTLPADKNLICLINKAEAQANNAYDNDTAQFCVEKQVTAVSKVPAAGPEMGIALLAGQLGLLGLGIGMRKKLS